MLKFLPYLYKDVPMIFFEGLLLVLVVSIIITISIKGIRTGWRTCGRIIWLLYAFMICAITVYFRAGSEVRSYNFIPFWSYNEIIVTGGKALFYQIICNILVFILLGVFWCIAFHNTKWWHALLMGFCISASIELSQFMLKHGFAEFDDIFHNTLGCMIGYGIYKGIEYVIISVCGRYAAQKIK